MKRLPVLLSIVCLLLSACGGTRTPSVATLTMETYGVGEPVSFEIDETVYVCTDELAYSIVQITQKGERGVLLEHSCVGVAGTGVDQFCENGEVEIVEVGTCSDAIFCEETPTRETVTWDQQAYVEISEDCAGQVIHREILEQVPEGRYQVRVRVLQDDAEVFRVVKEFLITAAGFDPADLVGATVEEAVSRFLDAWVGVPYRNPQVEVVEEGGRSSTVKVMAEFQMGAWVVKEGVVECQKRDDGWVCDRYSPFQDVPQPALSLYLGIPVFEYPTDGGIIDYEGAYLFKVTPVEGADGYLWGFFQDGEMVWENLRDEGELSGTEYGIQVGSEAHGRFVPGEIEVSVRARVEGEWTEAGVVRVNLR